VKFSRFLQNLLRKTHRQSAYNSSRGLLGYGTI